MTKHNHKHDEDLERGGEARPERTASFIRLGPTQPPPPMPSPTNTPVDAAEVRRLLHLLWGRAVGTSDYRKRDWLEFQGLLEELLNPRR